MRLLVWLLRNNGGDWLISPFFYHRGSGGTVDESRKEEEVDTT